MVASHVARPGAVPPAFTARSSFDSLLPRGIAVAATRIEVEAPLFPAEEPAIRHAVESRRREFITGRACAREALARLGLPRQALPAAADGSPRWPEGVVGSITHCHGYRAAAVGRRSDFETVGIDAEPHRRLPAGALKAIALPIELERVRQLQREAPGTCWDRLLFSAKESVYKAWFPLTGIKLGFEDAEVAFDPEAGRFSARLRAARLSGGDDPPVLRGCWSASGGIVATAITLPAGVSSA